MFLLFQQVMPAQRKRIRIAFWGVFLAVFLLYALTAQHVAFPGASVQWIAWVSGADVRDVVTHPLLSKLGEWLTCLPVGSLATRLNLLAALAGAFAVSSIFSITCFCVFEFMREENAVLRASFVAMFAGLTAATVATFSVPLWQAATQFRPEIFDTAVILGCLHLLLLYGQSENILYLLVFSILTGLGFAESTTLTFAFPFLWMLAIVTEWKIEWCRLPRLLIGLILSAVCMFVLYLYAGTLTIQSEGAPTDWVNLLRNVLPVLRVQRDEIVQLFPSRMWLPVFFFGIGSAILSFFCSSRLLDNQRGWSIYLLSLVLSFSFVVMLFPFSFTPYSVMMQKGMIPAFTYALSSIGAGLLLSGWLASILPPTPHESHEDENEKTAPSLPEKTKEDIDDDEEDDDKEDELVHSCIYTVTHLTGFSLLPVLFLILAIATGSHVQRILSEKTDFAERAADETLDAMGKRKWMVSNGTLDAHLLTRARERGQPFHLLCPYRLKEKRYVKQTLQMIQEDSSLSRKFKLRAQNMMPLNFHLFLESLFTEDLDLGAMVATFGVPDLWYSSSWTPVPSPLFFSGVKDLKSVNTDALLSEHKKSWARWSDFFAETEKDNRRLSHVTHTLLRRHFAMTANNLGVLMDDLGKQEEAYRCYRQTISIFPDHISALLNLFELISRGFHPEEKDMVEKILKQKVMRPNERYPLWALSRYYGYVRNFDLFIRMGWNWALSSSPGSVLAGLRSTYAAEQDEEKRTALSALMAPLYAIRGDYEKSEEEYRKTLEANPESDFAVSGLARLALQRNQLAEAQKILEKGEAGGVERAKLQMDWAALALASGDLPRARILLEKICDMTDPPSMALGMLALVMLEQKDIATAEEKVLPLLIRAAKGGEDYYTQIVRAKIQLAKKGKDSLKNARACFLRALTLRPDVQALRKTILQLDVLLKDKSATLSHALSILRSSPSDPYANYVMGTIRLEDGEYGDAEDYLSKSCSNEKTATLSALNNYAQVLCRIKRLEEAEKIARRAVEKAEKRYETWSTLAFVLARKGELDKAKDAMEKAWELNKDDPHLYLTEALIAIKGNDAVTARKALNAIGKTDLFSVADQREWKVLREAAAKMKK